VGVYQASFVKSAGQYLHDKGSGTSMRNAYPTARHLPILSFLIQNYSLRARLEYLLTTDTSISILVFKYQYSNTHEY
jgi:hypothetical protein